MTERSGSCLRDLGHGLDGLDHVVAEGVDGEEGGAGRVGGRVGVGQAAVDDVLRAQNHADGGDADGDGEQHQYGACFVGPKVAEDLPPPWRDNHANIILDLSGRSLTYGNVADSCVRVRLPFCFNGNRGGHVPAQAIFVGVGDDGGGVGDVALFVFAQRFDAEDSSL